MYDPLVGRFLEEDPKGFEAQDPHLFRYVHNNPTNATDPSGMQEKVPQLVVNESQPSKASRWAERLALLASATETETKQ